MAMGMAQGSLSMPLGLSWTVPTGACAWRASAVAVEEAFYISLEQTSEKGYIPALGHLQTCMHAYVHDNKVHQMTLHHIALRCITLHSIANITSVTSSYIHTYLHTFMHTLHTYGHTCMHPYRHAYIHVHRHAYIRHARHAYVTHITNYFMALH